jgi:subtilisin family serine protease
MFSNDEPTIIGPSNLTTNSFGTQAEKAWFAGHTGSNAVYVGVIDGGVQTDHPDLISNVWLNPGESGQDAEGHNKATNGKDDDGDSFPDDIHGWDFAHQDGSVYDGEDPDNHGTHVAGTIGAKGHNAIGVAGVNWNVTIIPAKFIGPTGGTTDRAVEAIDYFIRLKSRGLNIVAINNSWGGTAYDPALFEAIKRAARAGILFVAAAGNYHLNTDNIPFYPACYDTTRDTRSDGGTEGVSYDSVISVAALEPNGDIADFSDFGKTTVHIGAPGVKIMSTLPPNDYGIMSGTSMAAPHVTGAAALYLSSHPGATAQVIRDALLGTAIATSSLIDKATTGGRLDVSSY